MIHSYLLYGSLWLSLYVTKQMHNPKQVSCAHSGPHWLTKHKTDAIYGSLGPSLALIKIQNFLSRNVEIEKDGLNTQQADSAFYRGLLLMSASHYICVKYFLRSSSLSQIVENVIMSLHDYFRNLSLMRSCPGRVNRHFHAKIIKRTMPLRQKKAF